MPKGNNLLDILNRLHRFSSGYNTIQSNEDLGRAFEDVLSDLMDIEYYGLYLYDFQDKKLKLIVSKGLSDEEIKEAERTVMERSPGLIFRSPETIYIPDTRQDSGHETMSVKKGLTVGSRLHIPVMNGNEPVGAFTSISSEVNPFSNDHLGILSFICGIAGVIYGNILNRSELMKTSLIARETGNAVIITGKDGTTEWVNKSFERITGYAFTEIKGQKPGDLLQGPETDQNTVRDIALAIEQEKPIERDILNYHRNGSPYWVRVQIQPIFNNFGELTNFISLQTDITEKKKADDELKKAKTEAEAANAAKSLFLANMSHEIRTPLNAVIGLSKLLQSTHLTPEQKKLTDNLLISGENLLGIISDVLDFSKIEAGKVDLESVPFKIKDCLNRVYSFLEHLAEEKMNTLITRLDPAVVNPVMGDPVRLQQILVNLVNNALKFTQKGTVEVTCDLLDESAGKYTVLFAVKDTGIGISADKLQAIFEKFRQEDDSITRIYGGTGLGLAISKQLVELMGGKLSIESEKGKGSRFFFSLQFPVTNVEILKEANKKIRINRDALRDKHILVVEDNQFNQFIAQSIMEKWNVSVTLADNGQDAIEKAGAKTFDLILMDMQMPVLDGCSATRILREEMQIKIPIIALTAFATQDAIEKARESGMDDYMTKPFEEEHLYKLIASYLNIPLDYVHADQIVKETSPVREHTESIHYDLDKLSVLLGDETDEIIIMIEKFIELTPEYCELLYEAYEQNNMEELAKAAHKIKSSIELFASNNLKSNIRMIHEYARTNKHPERLPKLINYLKASIPLMIRQLEEKVTILNTKLAKQ